jgi:NADPH:quinone reductase-like Zn-dependent oxidoreductase
VLNSESPTFFDDLTAVITKLQPRLLYECIGGDFAGKVFAKMPNESEMIIYGNLTHAPLVLDSGDVLFNERVLKGFILNKWYYKLSKEDRHYWSKLVTDDLKDGGHIFGSHIAKEFKLEQWREAFGERSTLATAGKILLKIE